MEEATQTKKASFDASRLAQLATTHLRLARELEDTREDRWNLSHKTSTEGNTRSSLCWKSLQRLQTTNATKDKTGSSRNNPNKEAAGELMKIQNTRQDPIPVVPSSLEGSHNRKILSRSSSSLPSQAALDALAELGRRQTRHNTPPVLTVIEPSPQQGSSTSSGDSWDSSPLSASQKSVVTYDDPASSSSRAPTVRLLSALLFGSSPSTKTRDGTVVREPPNTGDNATVTYLSRLLFPKEEEEPLTPVSLSTTTPSNSPLVPTSPQQHPYLWTLGQILGSTPLTKHSFTTQETASTTSSLSSGDDPSVVEECHRHRRPSLPHTCISLLVLLVGLYRGFLSLGPSHPLFGVIHCATQLASLSHHTSHSWFVFHPRTQPWKRHITTRVEEGWFPCGTHPTRPFVYSTDFVLRVGGWGNDTTAIRTSALERPVTPRPGTTTTTTTTSAPDDKGETCRDLVEELEWIHPEIARGQSGGPPVDSDRRVTSPHSRKRDASLGPNQDERTTTTTRRYQDNVHRGCRRHADFGVVEQCGLVEGEHFCCQSEWSDTSTDDDAAMDPSRNIIVVSSTRFWASERAPFVPLPVVSDETTTTSPSHMSLWCLFAKFDSRQCHVFENRDFCCDSEWSERAVVVPSLRTILLVPTAAALADDDSEEVPLMDRLGEFFRDRQRARRRQTPPRRQDDKS